MPLLDFTEIPLPTSGAARDQFELFAREFLEGMGFRILIGPDRGPDAGRDLVVEETRSGIAGETRLKWLVSCKHKAHSGKSVSPDDEPDIHDRVRTHDCQGFMAVYSTVPSSGLAAKLNASSLPFEVGVFDQEKIERHLLSSPAGLRLAQRFFPLSVSKWKNEHPKAAELFDKPPALTCAYCHKSLLDPSPRGIVVIWSRIKSLEAPDKEHTEHVYWCCKGACDTALKGRYSQDHLIDGWEDIPDLIIPLTYIRWVMAMLNELHAGCTYSDSAHENYKELLLNLFPLVARDLTEGEQSRIQDLSALPSYVGGWGYDG